MALLTGIAAGASALTGLVGGIIGARKAKKAREEQEKAFKAEQEKINQQVKENQTWYDKERNLSTLDREENKAALSTASEAIEEQNKSTDSQRAIMGGSAETAIAQRANNQRIMGELARNIAASGTQYKQWVDSQHNANRAQTNAMQSSLDSRRGGTYNSQMNNASNLMTSGFQMFGNGLNGSISNIGNYLVKRKQQNN